MEVWKNVKDYEGIYEISNIGNIRSVDRKIFYKNGKVINRKGGLLSKQIGNSGYYYCMLSKNGISKHCQIHRLVAIAFIPNPKNKKEVNHINCKKLDNNVNNLEWVTPKENMAHAHENNLIDTTKTSHYGKDNKSSRSVVQIDKNTGEIIEVFELMTYASKKTKASLSSICQCCKNQRQTAKGFRWKYFHS